MLVDTSINETELTLSYTKDDGTLDYKQYPLENITEWFVTDGKGSKETKNWDNRPVVKRKSKKISKFAIRNFLDNLLEEDKELIWKFVLPKMYVVDIETEITEGFADPKLAKNKILTISIITPNKKTYVLGVNPIGKGEELQIEQDVNEYFSKFNSNWTFNYIKCKNEEHLLEIFLKKFVSQMPLITGWNFLDYDWTYIVNRCKRIGVDINLSSPLGVVEYGKYKKPKHVIILDYMEMVRKYDKSIAVKENYTLEFISTESLGIGKIKYDGNLQELYENDFKKYVYYNIVDSVLVFYLQEKMRLLDVHLTIAQICRIPITEADSPVAITETLLNRKINEDGKVIAIDVNKQRKEKESYEGAFVKEPIVGHKYNIAGYDYASLYPSIMRSFNISPDSFIKKLPEDEQLIKEKRKTDYKDCIITENGSVFSTKDSYLKITLTDLYQKRKEYKAKSVEYMKLADTIKKEIEKRF